ncbi:MAG: glycosyltransferase family 2 protein [candidate division NC10 bacterium]|nr:glycosyltransferase family 2 protein [candidate division NC10 bacterium]MDE2322843.1 glycosyltransferase family 2 protein [candidate division NC10 bacterium]
MESKTVSIIILNLNGEKIIRKCLDHLLKQTYSNFEIIVVDNGSSDGSLVILEEYLSTGKVSVVSSKRNLGVPRGRNLGFLHAKGDIIAYMDNDGYADKNWLEEAVRTLESDEGIGAVASTVFFNKKKIILNGAGGTINLQGYGGDFFFNAPYEFAQFPYEVLYSMAIGMVIRRSVMDQCGPLDPLPIKWYEDTELGIRIWKLGFRVVVSPNAWVDHDIGHSDQFLPDKIYLCEKARIRTVLKYYPLSQLPYWFLREFCHFLHHLKFRWSIPVKAWAWNLFHLPSALKWRLRFTFKRGSFWHLIHPSWRFFPPPVPNNLAFQPDLRRAGSRLISDGTTDLWQLNFGWYDLERDGLISYRWIEPQASAFFHFTSPIRSFSIMLRTPWAQQEVKVVLRRLGEIEPELEVSFTASSSWEERVCSLNLEGGFYELILVTERGFVDPFRRTVGIAVSSVIFW